MFSFYEINLTTNNIYNKMYNVSNEITAKEANTTTNKQVTKEQAKLNNSINNDLATADVILTEVVTIIPKWKEYSKLSLFLLDRKLVGLLNKLNKNIPNYQNTFNQIKSSYDLETQNQILYSIEVLEEIRLGIIDVRSKDMKQLRDEIPNIVAKVNKQRNKINQIK